MKIGAEEVWFLTGLDDSVEGARAFWHDGLMLMTVTCGAGGCLWLARDAQGTVPGFVVGTVDTAGAGDAFTAGLLAALLEEPGLLASPACLYRICRFANALDAITTTRRGAT